MEASNSTSAILRNLTKVENSTLATPDIPGITAKSILFICIGVIGAVVNFISGAVIIYSKSMVKKTTNILFINQCAIDFCGSVMIIATSQVRLDSSNLKGVAGELYCRVWLTKALMWTFFVSSTYNLVILTVKKYLDIIHPLSRNFTREYRLGLITFTWLIGVLAQVTFVISTTEVVAGRCMVFSVFPHPHIKKFTIVVIFAIYLYIPIAIMMFCHYRMYKIVMKGNTTFGTRQGMSLTVENARQVRMERAKRNIVKTLLITCICFFLCWILNNVVTILLSFGVFPNIWQHVVYDVSVYLAFSNCCINPVIYTLQYHPFQVAAKQLFCGKGDKSREAPTESSSSTNSTLL